ncbi:MAG: hypothetical protein ACD_23C01044G0002, partial [uncultured bacterium]
MTHIKLLHGQRPVLAGRRFGSFLGRLTRR